MCKSSFFHVRNISRIRRYLSVYSTETLVYASIICKLDCCNSLLYGACDFSVWNDRLPIAIKSSESLNTFKAKLKTHLFDMMYFYLRNIINSDLGKFQKQTQCSADFYTKKN